MNKSRRIAAVFAFIVIAATAWLAVGTAWDWIKYAYAASVPRTTEYPSSAKPDLVCLTWSDDPASSQTVQWRTASSVTDGIVQFRKKDAPETDSQEAPAHSIELKDPLVANDPENRRFTSTMSALQPATVYTYRVGSKQNDAWSDWSEFTTAPKGAALFSFVFLGDIQCSPEDWEPLMRCVDTKCPQAACYLMAGDLANNGNSRDLWDGFFAVGRGVFDRHSLVPVFGNHDFQSGRDPRLYSKIFTLPHNGPDNNVAQGSAYSFRYGNALFVVLDSNQAVEQQAPWLERQLAGTDAVWKFVAYHHPAYSSKDNRDNPEVRDSWCPIFDKYHVDVAFQGHDHAYLRTPPLRVGHAVNSPAEGTYYVIAVSGKKFYKQSKHDYTAVGFEKVPTYQIIDIQTAPSNRLTYRAYDKEGATRDEFVIEKPAS